MSKLVKGLLIALAIILGSAVLAAVQFMLGAQVSQVVAIEILLGLGMLFVLYEGSAFISRFYIPLWGFVNLCAIVISAYLGYTNSTWIALAVVIVAIIASLIFMIIEKAVPFGVAVVIAMIAAIFLLGNPFAGRFQKEENVTEDDAMLTEIQRLVDEKDSLNWQLEEALQENEVLRKLYEEHVLRCGNCPICNGEMTLEELDSLKEKAENATSTASKGSTKTPATSGNSLGDGAGNGAGTGGQGSVTPVYDPQIVKPGSTEPVQVVTPGQTVDFGNTGSTDIIVEDREDWDDDWDDDDWDDDDWDDDEDETARLSYRVDGNYIYLTAGSGFKATSEPWYYVIAENVTIEDITTDGNTAVLTFTSENGGTVEICKGFFKKGSTKTEKTLIDVSATKKPEEPSTDPSEPSEDPSEPSNPEMVVNSISVRAICDSAYEGDTLQYAVTVDGSNVDFGKLTVSMGTMDMDGTWNITAPAESGTATVSYGDVSETVNFTVLKITSDPDPSEPSNPSEPEDPTPEQPTEPTDAVDPSGPTEPAEPEMLVKNINVEVICDTGYEGDSLQYVVVADGENIDYKKMNVSRGNISVDGTWTFNAPSESGTATVSYGTVAETVEFTVNQIGNVTDDIPEETIPEETTPEETIPEETTPEETTPEETIPEETTPEETTPEETIPEETTPEETIPEETTPEETTPEETTPEETIPEESEPEETNDGELIAIEMFDEEVVCTSDIQGEIIFEGDIDWDEVEVDAEGLSASISSDGTITIRTTEVAGWYTVTVSYNGSTVSADFAVTGVSDAEIDW